MKTETKNMATEMLYYYFTRTLEHIQRVQKNMLAIACSETFELSIDQCRELMENALRHDQSKFSPEQFFAYMDFSWCKKNKTDLTEKQQAAFDAAWIDHQKKENHHPNSTEGLYKADFLESIEIACDLQAMAQEFGEGSGRKFFENVWKSKNSQYFYDDFNWIETCKIIEKCFSFFEAKL